MKKRSSFILTLALMLIVPILMHTQVAFADVTVNKNTPGGGQEISVSDPLYGTYSAYLHLPSDYNTSSKTYPLLIFLHGVGEKGTDLSLIYNNSYAGGPAYLAEHGQLGKYTSPTTGQQSEFIVIAPQSTWFSLSGQDLNNMLKLFVPKYRIDTNRIYPTGLSAGGQGVTEYMVHSGWTDQYPAAAVVPMSEAWYYPAGSANVIVADKVYNWGFGSDPADQFGVLTHNLMNEINAISPGMARYTNYSGGHCCWNTFYDPAYKETIGGKSMNIYEWMLQYSRGGSNPTPPPTNQSPTANAGTDKIITLPTSSINLSGSGNDSDGTIASYSWNKQSGTGGTIISLTAASTTISGLTVGTYVYRLTVTDNNGATGYDDVTITVLSAPISGGTLSPYGGTARAIPGTIQVEDYDNGGMNVAYFDYDALNQGLQYRSNEGVDIETTSGGGYNLGWTLNGEWMKYSVNVATTGIYTLQARVAGYGGTMNLEVDGTKVATIAAPSTGTFQTWQTISVGTVSLTAGAHVLRLYEVDNGFNFDWFSFTAANTTPTPPANVSPTANAGSDKAITLPTNSVSLSGSGTDTDGSIASYAWSQVSGPSTATIASASSSSTTVSNLVVGTYTFRLTVTDNAGAKGNDDVIVAVASAVVAPSQTTTYNIDFGMSTTQTTVAGWNNVTNPSAGTAIALVNSTGAATSRRLQVTDSFYYNPSLPTDSSINSSGTMASSLYPAYATYDSFFIGSLNSLTDNNAAVTLSGLDSSAQYDFRFYASRLASDSANRTTDYTVNGKTVTLNATNNTNGYVDVTNITPTNGSIPIVVTRDPGATYGYLGALQITEHASTGGTTPPANVAPTANAGTDKSITLPTSSVSLTGSGADTDGTITSYSWTKQSGTGGTIVSPTAASTMVSGLTAGTYTFRLTVTDNAGATGFDDVQVTVANTTSGPLTSPYGGTRWAIPGTIQAEDFDLGGDGIGYHDTDPTNAAMQYRPNDGVDIEKTADATGAYNVGWVNDGEWTSYAVNVATAGNFTVQARTASPYAGKTIRIEVDGTVLGTIVVPQTYQWQSWASASATIPLTAGSHTIKMLYDSGININYFTFSQVLGAYSGDPASAVVVKVKGLLNVRSAPVSGSIIGKVPNGMKGTITMDSKTWPQVTFENGLTGYVSRAYLTLQIKQ